eukprot:scaffold243960_cov45-Prasinocladus_malaysianus.AAC.1
MQGEGRYSRCSVGAIQSKLMRRTCVDRHVMWCVASSCMAVETTTLDELKYHRWSTTALQNLFSFCGDVMHWCIYEFRAAFDTAATRGSHFLFRFPQSDIN